MTAEESAARIRQTAEGLRDIRHMLDTMSWRYVMFYAGTEGEITTIGRATSADGFTWTADDAPVLRGESD